MSLRAVVLGGEGLLGRAFKGRLPELGFDLRAAPGRAECDITSETAVRTLLERHRPDVVLNAAGFTNVDKAEAEPAAAYLANAIAPERLARETERLGASFVHYSTDYVFDGEQERPYDEFDPPSPQGLYARSKLAGERLVLGASRRAFVVRVGCLYGPGGRNFPSTLPGRLLAGETILADASRKGSPTWVDDVVRTCAALARTEHFGLYHCTAAGETSWYDYAAFLAAELGLPGERVRASDPAGLKLVAPRPRRAILDNLMLRLRGLDTMPTWQEAARRYLRAEVD
jgi:dTDP-4-dehydrorhamnose reductase